MTRLALIVSYGGAATSSSRLNPNLVVIIASVLSSMGVHQLSFQRRVYPMNAK